MSRYRQLAAIVIIGTIALGASAAQSQAASPRKVANQAGPTTSSSGMTQLSVMPPRSPAAVLYDQMDNPAGANLNVSSQDFETANDAFDNFAADDFVVPAGQQWTITGVDVSGAYSAAGPAAGYNVYFYNNAGSLPGALVSSQLSQPYTGGANPVITLGTPVVLSVGTYWVSVQARQDFTPAGQWFWNNRAASNNSGAAWQNPGGGFGVGCATWGNKLTCLPTQTGPDQLFRLNGTSAAPVTLIELSVE